MAAFSGVGDAPGAALAAERVLREADLVMGDHDPEAVLAWRQGKALRPGPKAVQATVYGDRLNTLSTNGVVFIGERYFDAYAVGFAAWFECPACGQRIEQAADAYGDQMSIVGLAAMQWSEGQDDASARCLLCSEPRNITLWRSDHDFIIADMAVEFWNWPDLAPDPVQRAEWWHVDIVAMLEAAVDRPAMLSGHKI
jgi:hypothetical protein